MRTFSGSKGFGVDRFSGIYIWILFVVVFGALSPDLFLNSTTLRSVATEQAVVAMLGLALVAPLACGVFDLSIGAHVTLSAVLVSMMQERYGFGMWEAIAITLTCGILIGTINGFIVVYLKVSSFIGTLGVGTILAAVQTIATNNLEPLPPTSRSWSLLTQHTVLGFPMVVWYLLVLAVVLWWLLEVKPFGRYVYAVGGNAEAARLSGLRVDRYTWLSFILCGAITSLAGVFYASLVGPSLTFGSSLLLPAFAAAFLGFTQIRPGRFNVWGTVIAVYVLATGVRGLQMLTSVQWLNDMFNGVALILAVAFAGWRQRARLTRKPPEAPPVAADDAAGSRPDVGAHIH
ncbi:ABC transporter permease [Rhodococcus rhodochrous]|nr:ABC transporter permease [Rhodococcus rhodochrous]